MLHTLPQVRLRRLRYHPLVRKLVQETQLQSSHLVQPLFLKQGHSLKMPIKSMPGYFQWSVDRIEEELELLLERGVNYLLLFGIPECKDELGSDSYAENGIIQQAIRHIKRAAPEMLIISDVCLCEYTSHGHCGKVVRRSNSFEIDNDATLELLVKQAISHAQAGSDLLAPSGMMDGTVGAIRRGLNEAGFSHLPILSYTIKYASAMYGPFREAAEGAPQFGDRRSYQMDYANGQEALRECALDIEEGVDILMVKPAHTYLDIIHRVKQRYPELPLGAYHTSGEYAMLKAAAERGWVDERAAVLEVLTAIRRAGADFIISYYTKEVAAWLQQK